MIVKLNVDDQFGPDGPQRGAHGTAHDLRVMPDGDIMLLVEFHGRDLKHVGQCWVLLDQVLWPDTRYTETVMATLRGAVLATPDLETA